MKIVALIIVIALVVLLTVNFLQHYEDGVILTKTLQSIQKLPDLRILGSYYINMDSSIDRKEAFLKRYNGYAPPIRFSGVLAQQGNGKLKRGQYGALLAHANLLSLISSLEEGWYLVMEDDAAGDFASISKNDLVKNVALEKKFINLSKLPKKSWFTKSHSLSHVNEYSYAYLIHSSYAQDLRTIVLENSHSYPVDSTIMFNLKEPRFPFYRGNSKGGYVSLISSSGEESLTERLNAQDKN